MSLVHLRSAGVSLLLDLRDGRLPAVVHWGAALFDEDAEAIAADEQIAPNSADVPLRVAVLPEPHAAWVGRPGLSGSRGGSAWAPLFTITGFCATDTILVVDAADDLAGLSLRLEIEMTGAGLVRMRATVTNDGDDYHLEDLTLCLPIPARAREVLDFAGRWSRERTPQRSPLTVGTHERENRRGRTGPDSAFVLSVGTPGFGFAGGEIWALHVGFSGNHRHFAERQSTGRQVLGGGEILLPGEVVLGRGEHYTSPWIYAVYSDGLDDQARRFHRYLRGRPEHPRTPRPVTLNVWEAVYFDHSFDRLAELADLAAKAGVERFVLDDGWFRGRRDDTAGLGDWYADESVWPGGLHPLADRVRDLGMAFGLWFEPEMINLDSDTARAHPDWIMQVPGRLPVPARHQQVLDLGNPEAYAYILERLTSLVEEYRLTYLKWDQNRDLVDAGTGAARRPGVHGQTLAVYRLMAELRSRFPGLEIESCASGGARVDLGVLQYTQRVWASDCTDPLERQSINRWTGQLVPPEMLGTHVAAPRSHTTGRVHDLSFRAAASFFGHFGIEWDLTAATPGELAELAGWVALHKEHRDLLHTGDVVRLDIPDPSVQVSGVIAADRRAAVIALTYVTRSDVAPLGTFTLPGLDPDRHYRIHNLQLPAWVRPPDPPAAPGVVLTGRALAAAGLQFPASDPEQTVLFRLDAID